MTVIPAHLVYVPYSAALFVQSFTSVSTFAPPHADRDAGHVVCAGLCRRAERTFRNESLKRRAQARVANDGTAPAAARKSAARDVPYRQVLDRAAFHLIEDAAIATRREVHVRDPVSVTVVRARERNAGVEIGRISANAGKWTSRRHVDVRRLTVAEARADACRHSILEGDKIVHVGYLVGMRSRSVLASRSRAREVVDRNARTGHERQHAQYKGFRLHADILSKTPSPANLAM